MLVLTRKVNESITIGNDITVEVLGVRGGQVRLGIKAPKETSVNRTEVHESIQRENQEAARTPRDLELLNEMLTPSPRNKPE